MKVASALVLGFALALVPGSPAAAHARLVATNPGADVTVERPGTTVTLTFSEPIKAQYTTVVVAAPGGPPLADDAPRVADTTITQPVRTLPAGRVRVAWRTVSRDGHPIQGEFTFTVAGTPGEPSPSVALSNPVSTPPAPTPWPWSWFAAAGLALTAAATALVVWRRRR